MRLTSLSGRKRLHRRSRSAMRRSAPSSRVSVIADDDDVRQRCPSPGTFAQLALLVVTGAVRGTSTTGAGRGSEAESRSRAQVAPVAWVRRDLGRRLRVRGRRDDGRGRGRTSSRWRRVPGAAPKAMSPTSTAASEALGAGHVPSSARGCVRSATPPRCRRKESISHRRRGRRRGGRSTGRVVTVGFGASRGRRARRRPPAPRT